MSGVGRTDCPTCEETYKRVGRETPCYTTCGKPERIVPYNIPFIFLYQKCASQLIVGGSGAVALDAGNINQVMDWWHIDHEERQEFWDRLQMISNTILKLQNEEAVLKREQAAKTKK